MAECHDRCAECSSLALVKFGRDQGSRLTLIYWVCVDCGASNATAWDWEFGESVHASVGYEPEHYTPGPAWAGWNVEEA